MNLPSKEQCLEWAKESNLWAPPDGSWTELNTLIHRAYREGAEAMREEAAKAADDLEVERTNYCMNVYEEGEQYKSDVIKAIRNLKVEE